MQEEFENEMRGEFEPLPRAADATPLWSLLRRGDRCSAQSGGVEICGLIDRVLHLSGGRTMFRVSDELGNALGLYDASEVFPLNPMMVSRKMTSYELQLLRFEPKGMSTATCSVY